MRRYIKDQDMEAVESVTKHNGHNQPSANSQEHNENIRRLKSAEGHLRGVQRMLEEGQYCIDVIQQIRAVQAALNKVTANILEQHLNSCVITALKGEDPAERERVLNELMDVFDASTRT